MTEKVGEVNENVCRYENFRQAINYDAGGKFLNVYRWERRDATQPWHTIRGTYTTASQILDVAATHGGDVLYLALLEGDGQLIVEKWWFDVRPGRWIHVPPANPGPTYTGNTQIKGGGEFQDPSNLTHVAPERTVVFRGGQVVGKVSSIGADPEGRFLLLHEANSNANKLWRVSLQAEQAGTPTLLYDCLSSDPTLGATFSVRIYDHPMLKRVWLFTNCPKNLVGADSTHVLLIDHENDGSFDSKVNPGSDWEDVDPYKMANGWRPLSSVTP